MSSTQIPTAIPADSARVLATMAPREDFDWLYLWITYSDAAHELLYRADPDTLAYPGRVSEDPTYRVAEVAAFFAGSTPPPGMMTGRVARYQLMDQLVDPTRVEEYTLEGEL